MDEENKDKGKDKGKEKTEWVKKKKNENWWSWYNRLFSCSFHSFAM